MIAEVDAMLGMILTALENVGRTGSTVVILSSGQGEPAAGRQPARAGMPREASVRVPLIFRGPGIRAGQRVGTPVSLLDIHPTLLDMAGVSPPDACDGASLKPALCGRPTARRDWVFCEHRSVPNAAPSYMLRRGEWKYIDRVGQTPGLFNLAADPREIDNQVDMRPERASDLNTILQDILESRALQNGRARSGRSGVHVSSRSRRRGVTTPSSAT